VRIAGVCLVAFVAADDTRSGLLLSFVGPDALNNRRGGATDVDGHHGGSIREVFESLRVDCCPW